jgi:hypothetical protein
MNITIFSRPQFKFDLPVELLNALVTLALQHYDFKCRSAADVASSVSGKVNGFLTIWDSYKNSDSDAVSVSGVTWDTLDITLKILEIRTWGLIRDDALLVKLDQLVVDIYRTLDLANKNSGAWVKEYVREEYI